MTYRMHKVKMSVTSKVVAPLPCTKVGQFATFQQTRMNGVKAALIRILCAE